MEKLGYIIGSMENGRFDCIRISKWRFAIFNLLFKCVWLTYNKTHLMQYSIRWNLHNKENPGIYWATSINYYFSCIKIQIWIPVFCYMDVCRPLRRVLWHSSQTRADWNLMYWRGALKSEQSPHTTWKNTRQVSVHLWKKWKKYISKRFT